MESLTIIKRKLSSNKGQILVELLLAIGLAAVLLPSVLTGLLASRDGRDQQEQRLKAVGYLRESVEAVRVVKENWNNLPTSGTYYPQITDTTWTLQPGAETIGDFVRQIEIENVYRDSDGNLSLNPSDTLDPSTKRIASAISWQLPYPSSVENVSYVSRYVNAAFTHTTETTFITGTLNGTIVQTTSGSGIPDDGEVVLGAGGGGNWCEPNLSITALDLPKSGVANAISAIEGKAFAGTGENASGVSYASIDIANSSPPVATIEGTFSGYKTNDIFGEENYVYLATDTNSKELVIIDISQTPYTEAGYFNAPGNVDGLSVFVLGNIGYLTTSNNQLHTFDLSSKSGSRNLLGSISLSGTGASISVVDSYIYVAESGITQLQIIDVSPDGASLTSVAQAQVSGGGGKDVFVNSTATRAYLTTAASLTQDEFFIIDVSVKTGTRTVVGSYDTNGMDPRGVTIVPGNKAIVVGAGGIEYQVIDISSESTPAECGGLEIDSGVNGVASILEADGDAYSYIITGDLNAEFKIIEGGPGGTFSSSGTYESPAFDAASRVTFNYFTATVTQPASTTITVQVAVADALDCNTATYEYLGPDGTTNTNYTVSGSTISGTIPYISSGNYQNPGRCVKYKADFTSEDSLSSPIFADILVNYSL